MSAEHPDVVDAVLVAAGKYHDIDYARLELLKLLGEHEHLRVQVASDYHDLDAIARSRFLVTYTCDLRPTEEQQEALARYVEGGGKWIALHGTNAALDFTATGAESSIITAEYEGFTGEAQVTVVAYRQSGDQQDFFFVLPFEDPVGTQAKPLDFGTEIPALDVFFMMDTTGSMAGEISNLQTALTGTIIPGIQGVVANTEFGAGVFEDFPIDPYGSLQGSEAPLTASLAGIYLHGGSVEKVRLAVAAENLHFFDKSTGERIGEQ